MKIRTALQGLLAIAGVTLAGPAFGQTPSNKGAEHEVIRITKAQWAAEREKNTGNAMRHIASDYTEFNPDYATRLEGKDLATRLQEAEFQDSGKLLVSEMTNPKVQVYGNVAVLSYNFVGVTQDKDGKNTPTRAKSTRVYVRQGNDWMLVHANFGDDPLPQSP